MVEEDYYSIVDVSRNASDEEIKRAFRRLALKYHPDRCPGDPESGERFKAINEAYAVLGDRDKRREYDHFGPNRFSRRYREDDLFRAFDFKAIFGEFGLRFDEDLVDRFFCGRRWKRCGRGRRKFLRRGFNRGFPFKSMDWDRHIYDLPVNQNEAIHGAEREIVVETNGRLRRYLIRIPPGMMGVINRAKALIARGIRLVMGGYHLFSAHGWEIIKVIEAFEESGVERVCPCHCTGNSARSLFRESYGEKYVEGVIQFNEVRELFGLPAVGFLGREKVAVLMADEGEGS